MSNDNGKQQQTPAAQAMAPVKVKALYFLAPDGVRIAALRLPSGEGRLHSIVAGKQREAWRTEILREPWHRMYRVSQIGDGETRVVFIPESAASYAPLEGA